jgi:hypothetical protein
MYAPGNMDLAPPANVMNAILKRMALDDEEVIALVRIKMRVPVVVLIRGQYPLKPPILQIRHNAKSIRY